VRSSRKVPPSHSCDEATREPLRLYQKDDRRADWNVRRDRASRKRRPVSAIVFGLLYGTLTDYPAAVALAATRSNLSLLALDGAVVSTREAKWPEKNKDAVLDVGVGVRWRPSDPANDTGNRIAEFTLGDFDVLGQFLRDLAGAVHSSPEGR
jgi:hypothetical protein